MTSLLARYAESLFWLARYVERSASLARIIEVHGSYSRGRSEDIDWGWITALYADEESFRKNVKDPTEANLIFWHTLNLDNPSSIKASIRAARENARTLRALISADMWSELNKLNSRLNLLTEYDFSETRLSRTCEVIRRGCYALDGAAGSTLSRDESWHFYRLGMMIERADQTSRILDVRFNMAGGIAAAGKPMGPGFWSLLLRSLAAEEAFRRGQHGETRGGPVARFLVMDPYFPRSIAYCVNGIERQLSDLKKVFGLNVSEKPLSEVATLQNGLAEADAKPEFALGLHALNDWVQGRLVCLSDEIGQAFFGLSRSDEPAENVETVKAEKSLESQGQDQNQSQMQSTP